MAFKLKQYENQAKLSVVLAAVGAAALVCVVALVARNFHGADLYITYNPEGLFLPILALGLLAGLAVSVAGFFIALNSAGQRRNSRSALSWKGFFLNAALIAVLLSVSVFFYFTRNPQAPTGH